ncbi:RidA family protein [Mesorhizobium sp. M3A.F.Ca.ET.201.01.1.1]|uniref:RidA family protein n=1 Tax=Mesorhizobium sp. M3A.F.Ca.ET.201.01.1.1 TaxID=2563946 RepID=UPI001093C7EA|nr:RidA family protein [Mesorhizobium sp. M3A.F.Ca.ET.201.01.1.1]TGS65584.1 RidA family protein [Mesorhizobium sp. M3A.F.Ca.ET.201.01.1.1]
MIDSLNIVRIDPGWAWDDHLSLAPAVSAAGLIYVSGQLALGSDGKLVGADMETQSRQIFRNIDEVLRAGGASLSQVLRITCYVVGFQDYAAYSAVRGEVFGDKPPASTTVGVESLLVRGALLEVDAVALATRD